MRQHGIDLLPESTRIRSQAGVRSRRYLACAAVAACLLGVATTHMRFAQSRTRLALELTERQANHALATEATANELKALIAVAQDHIDLYEQIALPLRTTQVLAAVIDALPESATLDRLDLDTGGRRNAGSARRQGPADPSPARVLKAELAGFAESDEHIAELVGRLDAMPAFRDVSLDFSRTRRVRDEPAREFRLSFRIDLEARYELTAATAGSEEETEVAHVD